MEIMKKLVKVSVILAAVVLAAPLARAIPGLQLDAPGGIYDNGVESTKVANDVFDLWALLNSSTPAATGSYWVDVAIMPTTTSPANLGFFVFDGTTVNVTADMTASNPGLPPHGIYDTYYKEFSFTFNLSDKINPYDVSLGAGNPSSHLNASGSGLYHTFSVDLSGLSENVEVWFDLYHKDANGSVDGKAPFSHDVFSTVPEPTSFLLAALGIAGAGLLLRRRA